MLRRLSVFILVVLVYDVAASKLDHVLVKRQATTIQPCKTGTCLNGGICNPLGNVAICSCPAGYGGPFCQILVNPAITNPSAVTATVAPSISTLCNPNPCQNGGRCVMVDLNLATCACASGWTGFYCNLTTGGVAATTTGASSTLTVPANLAGTPNPFAVCFTGACLNSGTCMTIGNLGICICLPNFSGGRCEFPQKGATMPHGGTTAAGGVASSTVSTIFGGSSVTTCATNPCLNNQTCLSLSGTPTCFCSAGLIPPNCASPSSGGNTQFTQCTAANNPCQNSQPCFSISGTPVCFCGAGFLPPNCVAAGSGATTTAAASTTTTTASVVFANCPPGQCNANPCAVINGVQQCFCTNGSADPQCATG